ncbi:hypothetical protein LB506_007359 [Fusarium annulatum]|nr:hypothetical protein LB506_007359 [Fusarium annulatum]
MTPRWTGAIGPAIDSHATLDVLRFICLWYQFTEADSCIPDNRELRAWLPEQLFPRLWLQLDD